MELEGGINHSGIIAYPEDFEKPSDDYSFGDKKLIDRLWYYDDGYDEVEDWEKYLESLKPNGS